MLLTQKGHGSSPNRGGCCYFNSLRYWTWQCLIIILWPPSNNLWPGIVLWPLEVKDGPFSSTYIHILLHSTSPLPSPNSPHTWWKKCGSLKAPSCKMLVFGGKFWIFVHKNTNQIMTKLTSLPLKKPSHFPNYALSRWFHYWTYLGALLVHCVVWYLRSLNHSPLCR